MEKIFEGAKFGDKFKTKNGRIAIYAYKADCFHYLIPEGSSFTYGCNDDGTLDSKVDVNFEIVSKIDEQPKHSKLIYQVGSEPTFKVGDTIAYWDSYHGYEDEFIFGEVTAIEFDEHCGDWLYTFKDDDQNPEHEELLLQLCSYKKIK